jgi:LysM repeat protein
MSSIRPIITLAVIVAVGVFMFMKVNESPVDPMQATPGAVDSAPLAEVPPLTPTPYEAPIVPAPAWGGETKEVPTPSQLVAIPETSPTVPSLPEVPPLATAAATEPAPTAIPPVGQPIELPANIPTAQYPGDAASTTPQAATSPTPIPQTLSPSEVQPMTPPVAIPTPTAVATTEPSAPITPIASEADRYAMGATVPVKSAIPTPATQSAPTDSMTAPMTSSAAAPVAATAAAQSFAASWPEIQGALERQELVAAHEKLSQWYGNPNLSPAEKQQVESLLGQLAGTVVYSTEHRLEPPYTVQAGDSLQTIADKYEVPWQLLAKINGIPAANLVQPGQQLKVVHGPFAAVVELDESQMTLLLDGRYAGRFPVRIEQSAPLTEGEWKLEQKLVNPTAEATGVVSASYTPSAVDRVLVLRNESPAAGGATISITSGQTAPSGPTAVAPAAIRLSAQDAEEVADILSVGSTVTIRR